MHPWLFSVFAAVLLLAAPPAGAANPVVRFTTDLGAFDVELCDEEPPPPASACEAAVPTSVANFLGYVDRGDYEGSVIHRSATNATAGVDVIQGGGFRREDPATIRRVPTEGRPTVPNEFHQSNRRGTVAYARLAGQPNSATSQWFVNVQDNLSLDTFDGGFTVFGVVIAGMSVADAIWNLPIKNLDSECLDPLFETDLQVSANFRSTPLPQAFWDSLVGAMTCEDLPPLVDFADALIETEITRVPEPGSAAAGLAASAALAAFARRRARAR